MNVGPIPNHGERTQRLLELAQESDDVRRLDRGIVGEQCEVEVEPGLLRTQRDTANGRQPVAAIPALQQRRVSLRSPGAPHRWRQHEAAFIEKNQVRVASAGSLDDAGEDIAFPVSYGFFVSFACTATRLLRSPFQSLPQESADVVVMKRHTETSSNEIGDALRGPQLVGPTVSLGAFEEHLLQLLLLRERQARRRAEVRLGGKAVVGLLREVEPAIDGTRVDADNASDILYTIALLNG